MSDNHLSILSQTIADHAGKVASEEWSSEHNPYWHQILRNAELHKPGSTLEVDGRVIPIESITKALREEFMRIRIARLLPKLTNAVVETAFKKVIEKE